MTETFQRVSSIHVTSSNFVKYTSTSNVLAALHFNTSSPTILGSFASMDADGFTINISSWSATSSGSLWSYEAE